MVVDTFARRLDIALRRAGSSQARLAREADIDQSSISRYLRGQCEPNLRQVRAIADALNVAPSFLLADDGDPILLAVAGEEHRYAVFRGGEYVGEWIGERIDIFMAAEVVDGDTAKLLLDQASAKRAGRKGGATQRGSSRKRR